MKKTLLSLVLISGLAAGSLGSLFALDFSLRLNPGVAIPLKDHYKPAPNVALQGDLNLFDWVTIGGEGNFLYESPEGADAPVNFLYGGLGLGIYHNIFSRETGRINNSLHKVSQSKNGYISSNGRDFSVPSAVRIAETDGIIS